MDSSNLYLIQKTEGFTPQIGYLVQMMNYARHTTLSTIAGLNTAQLDYLYDENSNSIGALLRHMAASETWYQAVSFEGREGYNETEKKLWEPAMQLGDLGRKHIKNHTLEEHINVLSEVRIKTLAEFKKRDDAWLTETIKYSENVNWNRYWMWFHVFEDEINHRGQIRWLRKRVMTQVS